ncbi:MAG: 3-hydroxyacyl-ACP dehydratase FabZ family protein [Bacteroidota bacterium]
MNDILKYLPYKSSFLFVDNIVSLDQNGVTGDYTLRSDAFFYEDHFPGNPVTPGVIITEIMAQIGLVVLGIHLMVSTAHEGTVMDEGSFPLLTSTNVEFFKMVLPEEKVIVTSKKQYFRFGKLKCAVEMHNASGDMVAKGIFSGIIKNAVK